VHGRNFAVRRLLVKQHGAILGMQMQCNRTGLVTTPSPPGVIPRISDVQIHTGKSEVPGSTLGVAPGMSKRPLTPLVAREERSIAPLTLS
jgi:hypothetical protein